MKAVGAYDPKQLLHLCSLFEVVASPWSFFFKWQTLCASYMGSWPLPLHESSGVSHVHSAPPMAVGKCFVLTFALQVLK